MGKSWGGTCSKCKQKHGVSTQAVSSANQSVEAYACLQAMAGAIGCALQAAFVTSSCGFNHSPLCATVILLHPTISQTVPLASNTV